MQFMTRPKRKVMINITSLIDVLFLMLIFFMISSTFLEQSAMKLELPASESSVVTPAVRFTLHIAATGEMALNEQAVTMKTLMQTLKGVLPQMEDGALTIRADKAVSHGTVVQVMDISRMSGVRKLVIATKVPQR